jgi:hypothetical protein
MHYVGTYFCKSADEFTNDSIYSNSAPSGGMVVFGTIVYVPQLYICQLKKISKSATLSDSPVFFMSQTAEKLVQKTIIHRMKYCKIPLKNFDMALCVSKY